MLFPRLDTQSSPHEMMDAVTSVYVSRVYLIAISKGIPGGFPFRIKGTKP